MKITRSKIHRNYSHVPSLAYAWPVHGSVTTKHGIAIFCWWGNWAEKSLIMYFAKDGYNYMGTQENVQTKRSAISMTSKFVTRVVEGDR